jgi:hypothetical protein
MYAKLAKLVTENILQLLLHAAKMDSILVKSRDLDVFLALQQQYIVQNAIHQTFVSLVSAHQDIIICQVIQQFAADKDNFGVRSDKCAWLSLE